MLALDIASAETPTIMCLTRQAVPLLEGSDRLKVAKGAYVVKDAGADAEITLIGTGSEVSVCLKVAELLAPKKVRVVSMPSQERFLAQSKEYQHEVLGVGKTLTVAVEAWGSYGWARFAHASVYVLLPCFRFILTD